MADLRNAYHLDISCQPLEVGDRVAFATGPVSLSKGEIVAFTPKMVRVKLVNDRTLLRFSNDLVKLISA